MGKRKTKPVQTDVQRVQTEPIKWESEERYRKLVENLNEVIYSVALDGSITYVSPAVEAIFGYTPADLEGSNYMQFVHPEDRDSIRQGFEDVLQEKLYPSEYRMLAKNGEIRWVHTYSHPVREGENIVGLQGVLTDITDRKLMEQNLKRSEERYRQLVEQLSEVIYLVDLNGTITYVSPAAEDILGYTPADLEGSNYLQFVHPEDLEGIQHDFEDTLQGNLYASEYRILTKDGEIRWMRISNRPVRKGENIVGLHGVLHDITDRKLMEQNLKRSEERYRQLVEQLSDVIYATDLNGTITYVSPAVEAIFGYTPAYFEGSNYLQFVHPEDLDRVQGAVADVLLGNPRASEYRLLAKNGEIRWARTSSRTVKKGDKIVGLQGVLYDITDRKLVERELQRSEEKYRSLAENTNVGIVTINQEGLFTYVNPRLCKMFGYSEEEILGRNFTDFLYPGDLGEILEIFQSAASNPTAQPQLEFRGIHKDGHAIHCFSAPTIIWENGDIVGFSAVIQDITPLKQVEESLRENERKAQRLLNQQIIIHRLAVALGEILDLDKIYATIYKYITDLVDAWVFIVSSYHHQEKLIRAEYAVREGETLDISQFPPIPLAEPEQGTQSQVIYSGEPLYTPDHLKAMEKSKLQYNIEKNGSLSEITSPEDFHKITTRSALYVPMKVKGQVTGVIQLQSPQPDAYTAEDIELITALANVAAVAVENARLYEAVQLELDERKRVEQALQAQRDFSYQVMNALGQGLAITDVEGRFEYVNPTFARIIGYSTEALVGKLPRDVTAPDDTFILDQELFHRKGGESSTYELRLKHLDGHEIPVLITAVPRWVEGGTTGSISVITDLTERKRAEEVLRNSEAKYRNLLNNIPQRVFYKDTHSVYLAVNPSYANDLGVSLEDIIGKTDYEFFPEQVAEKYRADDQRIMASRIPEEYEESYVVGGETRTVQTLKSPVRDDRGNISGILGIFWDITDRKRTEEELRRSEQLLNATQRLAKVGGWEWDVKEQQMFWTDQVYRLHDMDHETIQPGSSEHIEKSLACYDPGDRSVIQNAFQRCVERGESYDIQFPFTSAKGRRLWIRTTANPVWEGDQVVKVVGDIMDITELKQSEEKLRATLAEKEVLLQEVHHRVKNNLQAIIYLIQSRLERVTDQQITLMLKTLQEQARTMALIYEQLYQSENLAEIKMKQYLSALASSVMDTFDARMRVLMNVECEDVSLDIGTAMPCGLMLNELLTNALKHAFPPSFQGQPRLNIQFTTQGDQCHLIVSDNGVGLPKGMDWQNEENMGLRLVRLWATHQIGGTMKMESGEGVTYHIIFDKKRQ